MANYAEMEANLVLSAEMATSDETKALQNQMENNEEKTE